jgi:hypothetical protein
MRRKTFFFDAIVEALHTQHSTLSGSGSRRRTLFVFRVLLAQAKGVSGSPP